jgi:hypothetical protein
MENPDCGEGRASHKNGTGTRADTASHLDGIREDESSGRCGGSRKRVSSTGNSRKMVVQGGDSDKAKKRSQKKPRQREESTDKTLMAITEHNGHIDGIGARQHTHDTE